MIERPYTAREVAARLGHSVDWFYRSYERLVREAGMPERLASWGRYRFHRGRMDAWLAAPVRRGMLAAANDEFPAALTLEQERALLAREYGNA